MKQILYITRYIWTVLLAVWIGIFIIGCATPEYIRRGREIRDSHPPNTCLEQANHYRDFLGGEICISDNHAFVIRDGKVYDSTNMLYSGHSINNWQVQEVYGNDYFWVCISKED